MALLPIAVDAKDADDAAAAKTSKHFVRPVELEPDIAFWRRIYTEVTTQGGLIHDPDNLAVVYSVMKFPLDLAPRQRSKQIEEEKKKYTRILERLAAGVDDLTTEERRVQALWPKDTRRARYARAAAAVRFQLGQADRFREGLVRSGAWHDHIAATFERMGLPRELAALPHVESSFNPYAYSKVGAAGMWQFMPGTGKRFLRIDAAIDERLDPYRSTEAAAKFLEQNYLILGSWPLALTAYNHGPGGMRRAKEQLGTSDITTIVRRYNSRSFGFASRNFYVAFLAALEIDADPERFLGSVRRNSPDNSKVVTMPHYVPASQLLLVLKLEREELQLLNPSLLPSVWNGARHVPRGYELRVPARLDLAAMLERISQGPHFDAQVVDTTHRVRSGETLSAIASRHRVSMAQLASLNNLRSPYPIRVGQVLTLPDRAGAAAAVSVAARPAPKQAPIESVAAVLPPLAQVPAESVAAVLPAQGSSDVGEAAEPESEFEAEAIGPALVPGTQAAASADPSDYSVHSDRRILVQAAETLGHYADWLEVRAGELRKLNRMSAAAPVIVGHKLKLDFSRVSPERFEARRVEHHRQLQEVFFTKYRIKDTVAHTIKPGESVWILAQQRYGIPIWLLRQYNPDLELGSIRPGTRLIIPVLEPAGTPQAIVETSMASHAS
ncbi:hypothetical protein ACG33_01325 [Steroidobacter denitrificans]|uniref:LysM domain-containing protein n=1 Tax=Steroidobacter denitrificans TaxID=465721 RepID=A0A127F5R2_STEDE|nr:LysM peptidoglycan-binding domain-containing protein [Steroidobacter denitrificans]AMN45767.1 hypothetical protein ACG33_01325 [Steroidobacter denitrificans]